MPNRILHEGLRDSRRVSLLTDSQFRIFTLLITVCDDFGRYHADPRLVKSACYPFNNVRTAKVKAAIDGLFNAGLIGLYDTDGMAYLEMRRWRQRTRQKKSKFPEPDGHVRSIDGHVRSIAHGDGDGDGDGDGAAEDAPQTAGTYGEFKNVRLTADQHAKLTEAQGANRLAKGIEILSDYMEAKGKRYKSCYAVLKDSGWVWKRIDEGKVGGKKSGLINTWHDPNPDPTMKGAF